VTVGGYMVRETSSVAGSPDDPADFWADHVRDNHGALHVRCAEPRGFRGGTLVQRAGGQQLVEFWSDAVEYARTPADIRSDDGGLLLVVARRGELVVEQDEAGLRLRAGQGVIASKARPLKLRHDDGARGWVLNMDGSPGRAAAPLDLAGGLGQVVRSMLVTLSAQHDGLDGVGFIRAAESVAALAVLCARPTGSTGSLAAVEDAVRAHVTAHATDPDITPAAVAHALGWSLRQVQAALERSGTTPGRLIRETRLSRAMELLHASPAIPIAVIAHTSGFRSTTSFGVAFKQRYGLTPGEARAS